VTRHRTCFFLPCILVSAFRRDLSLIGTRTLRNQGIVLIDPPSPHRPHLVRVDDDNSALFQDYSHYASGTPIIECLRSHGGLIGLPTHNTSAFKTLLSVTSGKAFDATEALAFHKNFTDINNLPSEERRAFATAIADSVNIAKINHHPTTSSATSPRSHLHFNQSAPSDFSK